MPLPVIHGARFREYELCGCPLLTVNGLECVSFWRVQEMLGCSRREAARRLGKTYLKPKGLAPAVEPAQAGPLFGENA
jgi:hypothetical protein